MKLLQQSIWARPLLEILNQFLESTVRDLQSGCIDLAHGQNEIMTTEQSSVGRAVGGQSQRKNTSRRAGFGKKWWMFYFKKYFVFCLLFFFKTPSVMFSLQLSSVQNSPEILCGKQEWMECYGQTYLLWVKWELSESHVQQWQLTNQQHVIPSSESAHAHDTFGVQSTLIQCAVSLQTVWTCYSCYMGNTGSHKPLSALLGNLGAHIFPLNSLQGTLKAISTSKPTGKDMWMVS